MAASLGHVLAQIQRWSSPRLREQTDAALLERFVQHRDESAFAALVARHGAMVLHTCRRILDHVQEIEDAFQATFLILARNAHALRQSAALPGYLHSVARRVALKARTKLAARGQGPFPDELSDVRSDPLARLTARELLTVLDEEVARLPKAQRSAIVLCCLEGRTQEEAARLLGWTAGSLKGHLERGRRRLQERLARRGIALSAVLTIVAVSHGEAASASLIRSTIPAALSGGIGSSASALARSVLKMMFLSKLAGLTVLVLTVALATSVALTVVPLKPPAQDPEERTPPVEAARAADPDQARARTDAHGDPLPAGAIARLGTVRFRHGGFISFLTFTPDGKRLISKGIDGVRVWESATGQELWHLALEASTARGTVDVSLDGKRLAVIAPGSGSSIQIWDLDKGTKAGSVGAKLQPPIRFSPDGQLLAAAAGIGRTGVELWDLAHHKKLRGWTAHEAPLWSLDFSADSRKLLSSDMMGKIHLWDVADGRKLQEVKPLSWDPAVASPASNAVPALSPDGKLLAILEAQVRPLPTPIANPKARISVWDTATGKLVRELECASRERAPGYVDPFSTLTLTPDGKRLVTTGPDSFLRIWDPITGQEVRRLPFETNGIPYLLAFSKDGKKLARVVGTTIQILDMSSGKADFALDQPSTSVAAVLLTPDGRTAITGGFENSLLVWDVAASRVRRRLEGHNGFVRSLQWAGDGRTFYSSGRDETLRVWDLVRGEERRRIRVDGGHLWTRLDPIVSPDGQTMIEADSEGIIRVRDATTGAEKRRFRLDRLFGMILSADGRMLVGYSASGVLRLWDVATGRTQREYSLPQIADNAVPCYSLALSPDCRLLAVGSPHLIGADVPKRHFLLLKDPKSGLDVTLLDNLPSGVDTLAFSPDGRMLAWGGFMEPIIRLLETATCRERGRLTGHLGAVNTLAFAADGERLISGSMDTTVLIWDVSRRFDSRKGSAALPQTELDSLWSDLAQDDTVRAYRSIRRFAASPTAAVPFLRVRLHPTVPVDERRLERLIADLDHDDFANREKATNELLSMGEQALSAYRRTLEGKPSLEVRRRVEALLRKASAAFWDISGERLRSLRAIEVLELAGTPQARDVLKALAAGTAGTRLTQEAQAALERLAKRGKS